MADIFISYAREDRAQVDRLAAQLERSGLSCWWDRHLSPGEKYLTRTEAELDAAKAVLVVWTRHSVGSAWVADEAGVGRDTGRIVPISLDGSMPPLGFRQFQVLDFKPWIEGDATPLSELVSTIARLAPERQVEAMAPLATPGPGWWRKFTRKQTNASLAVAAFILLAVVLVFVRPFIQTTALDPSIAVLPFANETGDAKKDYLAHGISSELIETLSQLEKLKVVGRGSSFTYKPDADPRKVGPALNVANILSGSVSQDAGAVRISFELADARSGRTIVSKTYSAALTTDNIASAQHYVAQQVAGALSIAFNVRGGGRLPGAGTRSLEAYDTYLQGLEVMETVGFAESEKFFAKAVAADPDYGAAWGLMAIAHGSKSWVAPTPAQAHAVQNEAYAMAKKAVTLDPQVSTSQAVFANLSTTQHNWRDAETASLRALDLSVNEIALLQRQLILVRAGRVAEAETLYRALEEVAPHAEMGAPKLDVWSALGRSREVRAAVESRESAHAESAGAQMSRLEALIGLGGPANRVRDALEMLARQPDRTLSQFARSMLAAFGDKEKARRALRSWYDGRGFENSIKYELVPALAAWNGDTDLVLRVWRDDLPVNVLRMTKVWGPAFAPARSTPAFKALMRDMGLVDYWRAYGWADKCRSVGASDFECG